MNAIVRRHRGEVFVSFPLRTRNPLNMSTGNSKLAGIMRTKYKRQQREAVRLHMLAARPLPELPVVVTVTRIAPSQGLDPHDGLGASLKGAIDEVAFALGIDDRDSRVTWVLEQRRGRPGEYAVEVHIVGARL